MSTITTTLVTYTVASGSQNVTAGTTPTSVTQMSTVPAITPHPSFHIASAAQPAMHYNYNTSRVILPPFNTNDPLLWFAQVEEQFSSNNVQDENAKYSALVGALPQNVSCEVRDILLNKPPNNPYTTLKTRIQERMCASLDDRLQRLLQETTLGDLRPSQLLIRMQSLIVDCNAHIDEAVQKSLFLQRMPSHVREILAATPDDISIEKLGTMADKIVAAKSGKSVNMIGQQYLNPPNIPLNTYQPTMNTQILPQQLMNTPITPQYPYQTDHTVHAITHSTIEQLSQQVRELTVELNKLKSYCYNQQYNQGSHQSRSRQRSSGPSNNMQNRNRSATPSQPQSNNNEPLCYYHDRYGNKARKCVEPCKYFQGNEQHLA